MFKLKFFGRKKNELYPTEKTQSIKLSDRNYDELKECDVPLKIWLSETVETKIDEMCSYVDTTASDIVRQILFIHLYGRYALFGLIERQDKTFNLNHKAKFCLRDDSPTYSEIYEKGVNHIADIKIWIPKRMKDDLQVLADKANEKLSVYARKTIITHLFGNIPPHDILNSNPPEDWSDLPKTNKKEAGVTYLG